MDEPRIRQGAPVLLFDRLVDLDPRSASERRPFRVMGPAELRASLRRELARLLDTRRPVSPQDALAEPDADLTVLEYGIADFSALSPDNIWDRQMMARLIDKAIRAFEPRLKNCRVTVDQIVGSRLDVAVTITGVLRVGTIVEPVSFPILMNTRSMERLQTHAAG